MYEGNWIQRQQKEFAFHIKWKRYAVKFFYRYGHWDFFSDINIEINTSCNRRCTYCPNSVFERGLKKNEKLMKEELFYKIIDELAAIKFRGRISPQGYGEPLLDPRLTSFMRYIKEKLPKIKITLITNGDTLTIEKYKELIDAGVKRFSITQHGNSMNENIKNLFDYLKDYPKQRKRITYNIFDANTPLYNRGGLIKPKTTNYIPRCIDPGNPLVIDCDGNIILCCNDYLSTIKFGNLQEQSIMDIWFSEKYTKLRKQIRKRQYKLPICQRCVGEDNKL